MSPTKMSFTAQLRLNLWANDSLNEPQKGNDNYPKKKNKKITRGNVLTMYQNGQTVNI